MAGIQVYLEEGFDHDRVTLDAGGAELARDDVTTRHQVGLATSVELTVPDAPVDLTVAVPNRGLAGGATVDPAVTPHVRVSIADGSLEVRAEAEPPRYA